MTSPPVADWFATSATLSFVFMLWHTWNYDRWRCLLFKRADWFRTFMAWVHIVAAMVLVCSQWIDVHILYNQGWMQLSGTIKPVPWQLWPVGDQTTYRLSAYLLTVTFWAMQITHAEEMIFWGYLIRAIRNPNHACAPTPRVWIKAPCFKVWTSVSVVTGLLLFGACSIETENVDIQRAYLYTITSGFSLLLSFGSFALVFYLPSFVQRIKDFGAGFEMQERLAVFKELNVVRTVCRVTYAICFMLIGGDTLSPTKRVIDTTFGHTFPVMVGQSCLAIVLCLSLIILLPRNMGLESTAPSQGISTNPMMSAYKRPTPDRLANHHFWDMGRRLNLEHDALAAILHDRHAGPGAPVAGHAYELSHSTSNHFHAKAAGGAAEQEAEAASPAPWEPRRNSVRGLQDMMGRLVGLEGQRVSMPAPPTRIVVTTYEDTREERRV